VMFLTLVWKLIGNNNEAAIDGIKKVPEPNLQPAGNRIVAGAEWYILGRELEKIFS